MAKKRKKQRQTQTHEPERGERGYAAEGPMKIPSWVPPVLYAAITLLLFRGFVFSSDMLYGSDTLALGYMAREFYANVVSNWGFPLWTLFLRVIPLARRM